ncbi:MAG: SUMF1/EgtB/PvdO family nonheme iron enzyme [Anaerolineae bacterium]|nr:SUMF1/EgtB/PvdO family nonheme iron enzyme [Anaerolineae bacterium]
MELVPVPAGEFLMGSDKRVDRRAGKGELPQHRVHLDAYWMGRYPVTNAQYRRFISETGFDPPDSWVSLGPPTAEGDLPVREITWADARRFCFWLSWKTGQYACIPGEAEWEKAARGTDGRIWPWGNERPNPKSFSPNSFAAGYKQALGLYSPATDSPYGCVDMVTNVLEICNTVRYLGALRPSKYPYVLTDGRESASYRLDRALRGGGLSSQFNLDRMRCAERNWLDPTAVLPSVGFRAMVTASAARWGLAYPDENENRQALESLQRIAAPSLAQAAEREVIEQEVTGYQIVGITWNWSGVTVRGDNLWEVEELLDILRSDFPKLKASKDLSSGGGNLPGSMILRITRLGGKDAQAGKRLATLLNLSGWQQFDPIIERRLTLKQQFGSAPIYEPEKQWLWLAKPIYREGA